MFLSGISTAQQNLAPWAMLTGVDRPSCEVGPWFNLLTEQQDQSWTPQRPTDMSLFRSHVVTCGFHGLLHVTMHTFARVDYRRIEVVDAAFWLRMDSPHQPVLFSAVGIPSRTVLSPPSSVIPVLPGRPLNGLRGLRGLLWAVASALVQCLRQESNLYTPFGALGPKPSVSA